MVTARFAVSAQDCNPATPARYFGKEIKIRVWFRLAPSTHPSWDSN
jgi:hypothetical protein